MARGKSPSGLRCPFCKKSITDVHVTFSAGDSYEWSDKEKQFIAYSICPDQGESTFECDGCKKELRMSSPCPNEWTQEELDDHH